MGDRPKDEPQAVPAPMAPLVTQPFGVPAQHYAYPPYPPVDLKPKTNWLELAKFVFAMVPTVAMLVGLIYTAGKRDAKVESLEVKIEEIRPLAKRAEDAATKAQSTSTEILRRMDLADQAKAQAATRRHRSRQDRPGDGE